MSAKKRSVAFLYPYLFHYRGQFHERVRALLAQEDVDYRLFFSSDPKMDAPRGDLIKLPWAFDVRCDRLRLGGVQLRYQHALRAALSVDLAIFQQENTLVVNYPLQLARGLGGPKTAFFGHGRNFQASNQNTFGERSKRFWTSRVDWWFAYTERSASIVAATGFPRDHITILNNAIDTSRIREELSTITPAERSGLRDEMFGGSMNVGVYVGALYPMKRTGFLIEAAQRIHSQVDDFHLMIIGAGEDGPLAEAAATRHPWIHYLGPKFGREKSLLVSLAKVFLMPGAAGLAILDSFAFGIPMVATDYEMHGPEIDYLEHGVNGVKEIAATNITAYADAVAHLLKNEDDWQRLHIEAQRAAGMYTVEAMAERFATGVVQALKS